MVPAVLWRCNHGSGVAGWLLSFSALVLVGSVADVVPAGLRAECGLEVCIMGVWMSLVGFCLMAL